VFRSHLYILMVRQKKNKIKLLQQIKNKTKSALPYWFSPGISVLLRGGHFRWPGRGCLAWPRHVSRAPSKCTPGSCLPRQNQSRVQTKQAQGQMRRVPRPGRPVAAAGRPLESGLAGHLRTRLWSVWLSRGLWKPVVSYKKDNKNLG